MAKLDGVEHAKKLWILEQVLETGSFRAAALKAKVSTPAISQAVSNLERLVGKPLLIRKEGKITPTDAAEQLIAVSKSAIQALREMSIRLEPSLSVPNIAWISFGAFESLAIDLLPKLTERLHLSLPKLKLTVRIANNGSLATMVRNGELCAAVVEENENLGRLLSVPVGDDRLGFYISAKTPRAEQKWSESNAIGTVSPGADGYPRYYSKFIQATLGKNFRPSVLSDSYEALRSSAVYGSITAILPSRVADRRSGELIEVTPSDFKSSSLGAHQILLISQPNCDPEEIQFLTAEITPLLGNITK
jgi:DNA-binding transcriptional LysR family regulator